MRVKSGITDRTIKAGRDLRRSLAVRCLWSHPCSQRTGQFLWPLFAGVVLESWLSPWPPAQLASVCLEWEILHMKELHIMYIKHKTLKCAQRGLCRASKPLICHTKSGGAEVVLLRWLLHLLTAILMLRLTQASNLFLSAGLDLCTLSLQRCCWHSRQKLTQLCHSLNESAHRIGGGDF